MRLSKHRAFTLVLLASLLFACGSLIGIEPITVDPQDASPVMFVEGSAPDTSTPSPRPAEDGSVPILDSGPRKMRVFLSSTMTNGKIVGSTGADGLSAADTICRDLAAKASLDGGSWRAWLSTPETDAIARITTGGPYYRLDDVEVVSSTAQLGSGNILVPISVIEDGGFPSGGGNTMVWTGTGSDGKQSGHDCKGWASDYLTDGTVGAFDMADVSWTSHPTPMPILLSPDHSCGNTLAHLYCFEQ